MIRLDSLNLDYGPLTHEGAPAVDLNLSGGEVRAQTA